MNNQINSSNNSDDVGNGVRLFGTWIRPNHPPPLRESVHNPNHSIRLFGQILTNIPIHNVVENPSIVVSSQPLPSSYHSAVHNSSSVTRTNIVGQQMGNLFVNPAPESEYNGTPADQTNSADKKLIESAATLKDIENNNSAGDSLDSKNLAIVPFEDHCFSDSSNDLHTDEKLYFNTHKGIELYVELNISPRKTP